MKWEKHMLLWLILTILFSALEVSAVSRNVRKLEFLAKPAVIVWLFLWLYSNAGLKGNTLWFGLGLFFSLIGDVVLLSDRMFLFGLIAFLFAHVSYITGFGKQILTPTVWSLILAVFLAVSAGYLLRRIAGAMRAKGQNGLVAPVILYAIVISVMLYAALSTIYNPLWKTRAAFFVSAGAFLFCASDAVLAWNKFVSPLRKGRVWNISLYYLGQIGLIAGVIAQFG
jgi:uncharacterized membrane protein YhhN